MKQALELARRGLNTTDPNPRVGCVLVKNGEAVGSGWHRRAGEAHAEALALKEAGPDARGATCYVTLEPCAHTGRTGPCADTLVAAGVARVVFAVHDPNTQVRGAGERRLREAGVLARAIRPPTVPEGTARIRFNLIATHTEGDVDRVLAAVPPPP